MALKIFTQLSSEVDRKNYLAVLKSWLVGDVYYFLEEWFDDDLGGLGGGVCRSFVDVGGLVNSG